MRLVRRFFITALVAAVVFVARSASAVTFQFDYTYDAFNFFNPATTNGQHARATLQAVGNFYASVLGDSLVKIQTPAKYQSPTAMATWNWSLHFDHPSTVSEIVLAEQIIPADQYLIFVGAKPYSDATLAMSGPGGSSWGRSQTSNPPAQDQAQINAIDSAFVAAITKRGEATGNATWGGSMSFDTDTPWHYDYSTPPTAGKTDFYTVAVHEMAHVLGFGASQIWNDDISGASFTGPASMANYGGPVPLSDGAHWASGTQSTVFGGAATQTAIMVPGLTSATRRQLTALDAAALTDIGWQLAPPAGVPGDYNKNGIVDAADYIVWRNTMGQSAPSGAGSGADGSGNGTIGVEDYNYWRARFGKTTAASGAVSSLNSSVPEPSAFLLFLSLAPLTYSRGICGRRLRRRLQTAY